MGACQSQVSHIVDEQVVQAISSDCRSEVVQQPKLSLKKIPALVYLCKKDIQENDQVNFSRVTLEPQSLENPQLEKVSKYEVPTNGSADTLYTVSAPSQVVVQREHELGEESSTVRKQSQKNFEVKFGDILKQVPLLDTPSEESSLLLRRRKTTLRK